MNSTRQKMLVAIDGSKGALKAVEYVGEQFAGVNDLQVTLFHVLPGLPPTFWDDGHILTKEEQVARKTVIDKWLANQKLQLEPTCQTAIDTLFKKGIKLQQIKTKSVPASADVAGSILTEAKDGGYHTLVIGRCSRSHVGHAFMGSIANTIINRGAGIAVCVVE